jgi:hypothetical protein
VAALGRAVQRRLEPPVGPGDVRDEVDVLRVRAKGREARDDAVDLESAGRDLQVMTA